MRTGRIEANLLTLNVEFRLPFFPELVSHRLAGPGKSKLESEDMAIHEAAYHQLRGELPTAHRASRLPERPSDETWSALNDLLVRMRLDSHLHSR